MAKSPLTGRMARVPAGDVKRHRQPTPTHPAANPWPTANDLTLDEEERPFFTDLSQQKYRIPIDFEQAVRVLESVGEGILILNADGSCLYANPAAGNIIGVPREDLLRKDVHRAVHPDSDACTTNCWFFTPFDDALEHLEKPDRWLTARGSYVPVEMSVAPLVSGGQVGSVIVTFTDATDKVRREQERLSTTLAQTQLIKDLESLNDQKTDFVYTVSHELRTPLTSILGYLELLLESESLDESDREWAEIALRNASRLLSQVEALLTVSRIEAGRAATKMAAVPVSEVARAISEVIGNQAEDRDIQLVVEADGDLLLWGDASQIERALINVAGNAVKFTEDGGTVWIDIERKGDFAQFRVEDNGLGIPEEDQKHLFSKFFRASNAQKQAIQGTGLGLAIVKAIVEDHGGRVAVRSEEGVGTVVAFTIPLYAVEPEAPSEGTLDEGEDE